MKIVITVKLRSETNETVAAHEGVLNDVDTMGTVGMCQTLSQWVKETAIKLRCIMHKEGHHGD